ncbi:MAG: OmpA family protein [Flavobacteriales bacterium]|nr:OmpA family protein [Flavobacteriales bacterium]
MKVFIVFSIGMITLASCVPTKKYKDLLAKEQACSEELAKYKSSALTNEALAKDIQSQYNLLKSEANQLRADTTALGQKARVLNAKYDQLKAINDDLEANYNRLRLAGASETAKLSSELATKKLELQRREDELLALENDLAEKQELLDERQKRVTELEEMFSRQEQATRELKAKVADALKGFESKGLTVVEKNGKIYVSLEAKLLFPSGSTNVDPEGQKALVELAKVLETEKELEIIVEGHTDTDPLRSSVHPKNNWELSVLRATSVIEIMLAKSNMDPKQLMAAGRSEFIPVDPNNKAKNRRIEIIISPNLNELYELISN